MLQSEHQITKKFNSRFTCEAYGEVGKSYHVSYRGDIDDDRHVAAWEPNKNGSLFDIISITGAFDENLARHYFAQLCAGMYQLHR